MIKRIRLYIMNALGFSKTEANGILVLIVIILLAAVLPKIYFLQTKSDPEKFTGEPEKLKKWAASLDSAFHPDNEVIIKEGKPEPSQLVENFTFNPNTVSHQELTRLGFSDYTISNLIRYREAGGSFTKVGDLEKIYGISQKRLEELHAFITLPDTKKSEFPVASVVTKETSDNPPAVIELNTVDTIQLKAIPGIGSVLSKRIVSFREKLGGFHDPNQLYEVYGLDSTVVEKLLSVGVLDKPHASININTDSINHLYQHPYLNYHTARIIINYRRQHGPFESVDQVKRIKIISDSLYQKIYPYLSIDL